MSCTSPWLVFSNYLSLCSFPLLIFSNWCLILFFGAPSTHAAAILYPWSSLPFLLTHVLSFPVLPTLAFCSPAVLVFHGPFAPAPLAHTDLAYAALCAPIIFYYTPLVLVCIVLMVVTNIRVHIFQHYFVFLLLLFLLLTLHL